MKIVNQGSDSLVLGELARRLASARLQRNLTQAQLARQAGVSKRTVERLESGESVQLSNWIRLCRALDLLDRFELLIPEPLASPIAQWKLQGRQRRRASVSKRATEKTAGPAADAWKWGDEA